MRDNLGETENEVEYENLRAKEALLMLRNNEVALVEEQVFLFCVVVFFVLYCVGGVVVQVLVLRACVHLIWHVAENHWVNLKVDFIQESMSNDISTRIGCIRWSIYSSPYLNHFFCVLSVARNRG